MPKVSIDFETRSAADLRHSGVHIYAQHPTTKILTVAWKLDGEAVRSAVVLDTFPSDLIHLAAQQDTVFQAFNAQFERIIWNTVATRLGAPPLPISRWRCTMALAAYRGLPRDLASLCAVLHTRARKLASGEKLIKLLCVPQKKERVRVISEEFAEELGADRAIKLSPIVDQGFIFVDPSPLLPALLRYNEHDVATEAEIAELLDNELPQQEQRIWEMDQAINDRGVPIDTDYLDAALTTDALCRQRSRDRLAELTALDNALSRGQFIAWLKERGIEPESLRRADVEAMLEDDGLPADVREALEERLTASSTSRRKYTAMAWCVGSDGRARGLFNYHGALTGRWTSSRVQLQNLPRQELDLDPEVLAALIRTRDPEWIELETGHTAEAVLRDGIRGMICAKPGHVLVACDFSSIEARVLAWLAGEEWKLDLFRQGADVYIAAAERIFPERKGQIVKGSPERQKGKIAELALGYQGWVGAYQAMAGRNAPPVEEIEAICRAWRDVHQRTVMLWRGLERAALAATAEPGKVYSYGRIAYRVVYDSNREPWLVCRLPNGKRLFYYRIHIRRTAKGPVLSYYGTFPKGKTGYVGLGWTDLYGGLLTENVVQATSREILAEAMLDATAEGYDIVMHVHDEIVAEVPEESPLADADRLASIMTRPKAWRAGLPIGAEGWVGARYRK